MRQLTRLVLLVLKSFFQGLTKAGLTRDAQINENKFSCAKLVKALISLNNITIPRCLVSCNVFKNGQLHVFADVSVTGIYAVNFCVCMLLIVTLCGSLWANRALPD